MWSIVSSIVAAMIAVVLHRHCEVSLEKSLIVGGLFMIAFSLQGLNYSLRKLIQEQPHIATKDQIITFLRNGR